MKQKAEITLEVQETIVIEQGEQAVSEYCPKCDAVTVMLSPALMAAAANISERAVFRLIESDTIHFAETGRLVVCTSCYQRDRPIEDLRFPENNV